MYLLATLGSQQKKVKNTMQTKNIPTTAIVTIAKGCTYQGTVNSQDGTAATWQLVQKHLAANPKTTRGQLFTLLQTNRNHASFVRYALGRGWLVAK